MRNPFRAKRLLSADEVASQLGVTPARVRQIAAAGKLPPPSPQSGRGSLWYSDDVEALKSGQRRTLRATGLEYPGAPLARRVDRVMTYHTKSPGTSSQLHIRAWDGPAPEGERRVVVLGSTTGFPDVRETDAEDVMQFVDEAVLGTMGASTVWFHLEPAGQWGSRSWQVFNLVATVGPDGSYTDPGWITSDVAELDRVVGSPVEWYPEEAYTAAAIDRWQRDPGEPIAVEFDFHGDAPPLAALRVLEAVPPTDLHAPDARSACRLLARHVALNDLFQWDDNDGTRDTWSTGMDWPRLFAARLVPVQRSPLDRELLNRYPNDRPAADDERNHKEPTWQREDRELLRRIRQWQIDVGPYGDNKDSDLASALRTVASSITTTLPMDLLRDDQPASRVALFDYPTCQYDNRYLDTVDFKCREPRCRAHREMVSKALGDIEHAECQFGVDLWGNDVATIRHAASSNWRGLAWMAVNWPTLPTDPIPDGSSLVADGDGGSRPVYLELPDGRLRPFPHPGRFDDPETGWNFGYGGTGPGNLIQSIMTVFEITDQIPRSALPHGWIHDQVTHSDRQVLRIPVADLRRRIGIIGRISGVEPPTEC